MPDKRKNGYRMSSDIILTLRLCFNMGNFPPFKNAISNYIIKFNGEKTRANGSDSDKAGHTFYVSLGTMFGDIDCHEFRERGIPDSNDV